ncbi:MAG TPA: hypothetical protein VFD82_16695 [Planctomycetota bacterium]|nr:hypothetical protein [Planctomycetota bacterium]
MAMAAAKERQLDRLLAEVPGETPFAARPAMGHASHAALRSCCLSVALVVTGAGTMLGAVPLREAAAGIRQAQEPQGTIEWCEAHGPASVTSISADVVNLRCFDFDDAACAKLRRFTKLERLDLGGKDVNDRGYSVALKISDAGVRSLGALVNLRWLSLATCHDVKGEALQALEGLPRLEHLDLTYSGVESPAIERLARLPSLRSLVLSSCMNFHGHSLAAVASSPGLRRLELRACTTLSAVDVMHLVKLKELRHLDLRDCQGRFRGQREFLPGPGGEAPPEPMAEDGIGITDDVVAAIAAMPLETLLLGGSESLTDAIGGPIAKMTTLRCLDVSNLPSVTGVLLAKIPDGLEALALDQNPQFDGEALLRLPPLASLRELGLSGIAGLDRATLEALLANKQLTSLRLGGHATWGKGGAPAKKSALRSADLAALATQKQLRSLELHASMVDEKAMIIVAALPQLTDLDISRVNLAAHDIAPLAACASLRSLKLAHAQLLDVRTLGAIPGTQLRELDLYGTNVPSARIREAARAWKGCTITMPDGRRWRAP